MNDSECQNPSNNCDCAATDPQSQRDREQRSHDKVTLDHPLGFELVEQRNSPDATSTLDLIADKKSRDRIIQLSVRLSPAVQIETPACCINRGQEPDRDSSDTDIECRTGCEPEAVPLVDRNLRYVSQITNKESNHGLLPSTCDERFSGPTTFEARLASA